MQYQVFLTGEQINKQTITTGYDWLLLSPITTRITGYFLLGDKQMSTQIVNKHSDYEIGLVEQIIMNPKVQRIAVKYAVKGLLSAAGLGFFSYVVLPAIFDGHDNSDTENVNIDDDSSWFIE